MSILFAIFEFGILLQAKSENPELGSQPAKITLETVPRVLGEFSCTHSPTFATVINPCVFLRSYQPGHPARENPHQPAALCT